MATPNETATYIGDYSAGGVTYPEDSNPPSKGAAEIRKAKDIAKATFPNCTGAVTATHTQLNQLTGVTVGGTSAGDIATINGTQTLTNKTISAASNTITGLDSDDLSDVASIAMLDENETVSGTWTFSNQVTVPATPSASTDAASKGYVDTAIAGVPQYSTELTLKAGYALGTEYSVAHGLSSTPQIIHTILERSAATAEGGWAQNDQILVSGFSGDGGSNDRQLCFWADATYVYVRTPTSPVRLGAKTTGGTFDLTGTGWTIKCVAVAI